MSSGIVLQGIRFCAAHFLPGHPKCSALHGHNYEVSVEMVGELDERGFILDFSLLKEKLRQILERLDHRILIPQNSPVISIIPAHTSYYITFDGKAYMFPSEDLCFLSIESTTAELLAKYICLQLKRRFFEYDFKVYVSETADARGYFEASSSGIGELSTIMAKSKLPVE